MNNIDKIETGDVKNENVKPKPKSNTSKNESILIQWLRTLTGKYSGKSNSKELFETIVNMIIDNYLFGVASVAANGNTSPVVFPGAAGAFF